MSTSDNDGVLQKKKDDELVNWREYEALKSHLTRVFTNTTDAIDKNLQDMNMRLHHHVEDLPFYARRLSNPQWTAAK